MVIKKSEVGPFSRKWACPVRICTPMQYGCYVRDLIDLHELDANRFPPEVYFRWASKAAKEHGYEVICRAAAMAVEQTQYAFSYKYIEKFVPLAMFLETVQEGDKVYNFVVRKMSEEDHTKLCDVINSFVEAVGGESYGDVTSVPALLEPQEVPC